MRQTVDNLLVGSLLLIILSQWVALSKYFELQSPRFPTALFVADKQSQTNEPITPLSILELRFQQGVSMLHAKQYDYALVAFNQVIKLSPKMPEAFVNMGYAFLGLKRYKEAEGYFEKATELRPYQGNAYWGLAVALDEQGDIPGAMGAMRTYIHLAPPDDPYVKKARSALWEWDSLLKKGPPSDEEKAWLQRRSQEMEDRGTDQQDIPTSNAISISTQ